MTKEQLQERVEELERDNTLLEERISDLEDEAEKLEEKVEDLNEQVEEFQSKHEVVKILADPSNWQGTTFFPVMAYLRTASPFEIAEKAL